MQRDSSAAYQLLVAARQGRAPQRPVERLALLQLLMRLHRQSHERTGDARRPRHSRRPRASGVSPAVCAHGASCNTWQRSRSCSGSPVSALAQAGTLQAPLCLASHCLKLSYAVASLPRTPRKGTCQSLPPLRSLPPLSR